MNTLRTGLWLPGLLLATTVVFAQTPTATITGRVLDAKTGQPLPFASVYLNNSTRGTTADEHGTYRLTNVPLGTHELVGSVLGHATARLPLRLTDARPRAVDLRLEPTGTDLTAVTVMARRSGAWQRQFRTFSRELLGNRPQARQCRITNSGVLSFEEKGGYLRARAAEPLIIENRALGYRITYSLLDFTLHRGKMDYAGTARFEELPPADARQTAHWQAARQKAYRGSLHHLLASLLTGTHEAEGFVVYRAPLAVDTRGLEMPLVRTDERQYVTAGLAQTLFRPGELPFERRLLSKDPLEVYYKGQYLSNSPYGDSPYAYSMLVLPNQAVDLTNEGWITQGKGLDVRGYLGQDRLATLLPADWLPADRQPLVAGDIRAGRVAKPDVALDSLAARAERMGKGLPPTVFVQIDKGFYTVGDPLWFSAFVLDAATNVLVAGRAGSPLHVELLAPDGSVVQHQWLQPSDGRVAGNLRLSDTLVAGTYRLRAYTDRDQPNNGPGYVCQFPLANPRRPTPALKGRELAALSGTAPLSAAPVSHAADVQFLPEGGRWLAGVPARLGIKALGADGRGQAVSGRIVDAAGGEVARFATNRLGMGQVTLTPSAGQRYVAQVETKMGGSAQTVALPPVETEGWALTADGVSDSSRIAVTLRATGRYARQPLYVTLHSRERLVYRQGWQLRDGEARFSLPTTNLPSGVSRLTLWDSSGVARAERLVYVMERGEPLQMRVITSKTRHEPRQPVVVGLQFRDGQNDPVTGLWCASVTDADQLPADTTNADIRTYLLLTAGLRGTVESPHYYAEPGHGREVDNLLLTQGWRRLPAPVPADTTGGWQLSGRAVDAKGQPVAHRPVMLFFEQGTERALRSDSTDAKGRFVVRGLQYADTVRVRARVLGKGGADARIRFERPGTVFPAGHVSEPNWAALHAPISQAGTRQTDWPALYRDSTARQLAEVVVRAPKPKTDNERRPEDDRASIHMEADAKLVINETDPAYIGVLSVKDLIMRLPGVSLMGGEIAVRGKVTTNNDGPLFLVDGVYVNQAIALSLEPRMVSRIELLVNAGAAIYGARAANGVIAIYTRKGKVDALPATTGTSAAVTLNGFATPREYYVPRYDSPNVAAHKDRRDVLYWQPLGQTDANGLARLTFPLSDTAKHLRIVVQGLTSEGVPMAFTWLLPVR